MSTSDKRAIDPLDKLVHEANVGVKHVIIDRDLDLILVVLTSGGILRVRLSDHPVLNKASNTEINDWRIIAKGIGIHWNQLDEDLSVKGMIRQSALESAVRALSIGGEKAVA